MDFMFFSVIMMFISGLYVYSSNRKHLLLMLMSLELMILSVFILMFLYLLMFSMNMYMLMFYLVFCVCESVLGLSILVSIIRTHGNDYFFSMNILW